MCRCVCRLACCVCFCKWAFVCLCVCEDTLKADACFGHVAETLRGTCVCVCEREREACTAHRLMTSAAAAAPDRSRVLHWAYFLTTAVPPQHPLLPVHRRLMHSTSPQGPRGHTHTHMCVRVCFFDRGASLCLQYHAHLNGWVRWQWASTLHPHAYTSLFLSPSVNTQAHPKQTR